MWFYADRPNGFGCCCNALEQPVECISPLPLKPCFIPCKHSYISFACFDLKLSDISMHIPSLDFKAVGWTAQNVVCKWARIKKQSMNINKLIRVINNLSIHFVWKEAEEKSTPILRVQIFLRISSCYFQHQMKNDRQKIVYTYSIPAAHTIEHGLMG